MFFSFLPAWANFAFLAVLLIAKYFLIGQIEKTQYYIDRMTGKGWMAATNVMAGLNGLVTALVLLIPAGLHWAIVFAVIDAAIHWLIGYYKHKKMLPHIDAGNIETAKTWLSQAWTWVSTIHAASYVSIATSIFTFVQQHPTALSQVLTWIKAL